MKKIVFVVLLDTTTYDRYNINSVLCILGDETTLSPIQSSDITPNPTISIPISTPVATYSTPLAASDSTPNDTMCVWTAITSVSGNTDNTDNTFGYFDICKLIIDVLLKNVYLVIICVVYEMEYTYYLLILSRVWFQIWLKEINCNSITSVAPLFLAISTLFFCHIVECDSKPIIVESLKKA